MSSLNAPIGAVAFYHARLAASRTPDGSEPASAVIGDEVEGAFDPSTGEYLADVVNEVWSGPVLVRSLGADQVVDFGDGPTSIRTYEVDLVGADKVAAAAVEVEHTVVVTSSQPGVDGLVLRVKDVPKSELSGHVTILAEERQHDG